MRLEQAGPYRIVRPAAAAVWQPSLDHSEWDCSDVSFHRTGGDANQARGEWQFRNSKAKTLLSQPWRIEFNPISLFLKLTSFGHLGLFAEQEKNWRKIHEMIAARKTASPNSPVRVLNLFAYTGAATLHAAHAGAEVLHLDASKGTVKWARDNAEASNLTHCPIRWIVDDAQEFVERELRRGQRYHGVLLDPPSYGRGNNGQIWKIEEHLLPLLKKVSALLEDDFLFVLLSSHSPGYTPISLRNILEQILNSAHSRDEKFHMTVQNGQYTAAEMVILDSTGKPLPSGADCLFLSRA